jgi:hypothetical protein
VILQLALLVSCATLYKRTYSYDTNCIYNGCFCELYEQSGAVADTGLPPSGFAFTLTLLAKVSNNTFFGNAKVLYGTLHNRVVLRNDTAGAHSNFALYHSISMKQWLQFTSDYITKYSICMRIILMRAVCVYACYHASHRRKLQCTVQKAQRTQLQLQLQYSSH